MREAWVAVALAGALVACGDDDPPMADGGMVRTDAGPRPDGGGMTPDAGDGADGGGARDSGTGGDGGGDAVLSNEPATCAMDGYTFADPANTGHYAAARLTPPRYPFTVTSVRYTVMHNPGECDADVAHEVLVFASAGGTPPAMPDAATIAVPAPPTPTAAGTERVVELTLRPPVVVSSGEDLYVAVQMARATDPLCVEECLDPGEGDRNWWSAAAAPPFAWRTLASYGNMGTLTIGAIGR